MSAADLESLRAYWKIDCIEVRADCLTMEKSMAPDGVRDCGQQSDSGQGEGDPYPGAPKAATRPWARGTG